MTTRWILTTATLLSGSLTVVGAGAPQSGASKGRTRTTAEIAAQARRAVVTIETTNADGGDVALGSGFVIDPSGVIVTNWHVMAGAAAATVTLMNGEIYRHVAFLDGDPTIDIAILKVPATRLPTLAMTSETPPIGSKAVAVGSPLGLNDTVSEGIVSAVRSVRGRVLVQTTTPIGPGSSGGPLINAQGMVFAVSTLMLEGAPLINFGVPARYAMGFVRDGLPERALPDVFHPAPAHKAPAKAPDAELGRTERPRADLSGTYFLSVAGDGADQTSRRQLLVAGKDVGLLRVDHDVLPVNVLRTNEGGEVAFAVGDEAYAGYQTENGFAYYTGEAGDSVVAVRMSQPLASNIGVYVVTSRSVSGSGDLRRVMDWTGEAAVIVDKTHMAINLSLSNIEGGSRALAADGVADEHGRFRLTSLAGSLEGTMTAGVIQAEWCSRAKDGIDVCMPVQARRR